MINRLLLLILSICLISCGDRDFSRGGEDNSDPDPLSGLEPDLILLFSKNSDSVDIALRQVSEDLSNIFFTDIRINLQNNRVSFENESVGELTCQTTPEAEECDLGFYPGVTGSFPLAFQDDYELKVNFQNIEGFIFDDAPGVFSAEVCDSSFGVSAAGQRIEILVVDKDDQETLVTFLFYDFGFQNQGQLPAPENTDRTSVYYGVSFDQFFSGNPYTFSALRKNVSNDVSFLEAQAIQTSPSFKRTLVCFND